MNTDEILKSLANLQKSLEEIDSARQQVINVVNSSSELAKVVASYKSSFEGLSINISQVLDKSKEFNLDILSELSKQTGNFSDEVSKLTEFDFNAKFQTLQQEVVSQFERDLSNKLTVIDTKAEIIQEKTDGLNQNNLNALSKLSKQTDMFKDEVSKLTEFDFNAKFQTLQQEVIKQFENDLANQLSIIDKKAEIIQEKSDELQKQVIRLESIDLEKHFDRHQKVLSDIFGAINSINLTLSGITQNLTTISQFFSNLQNTTEANQRELLSWFNQIDNHYETIRNTIEVVREENIQKFAEINKGIKTIRLIQICGIVVLIIISGLVLLKLYS